MAALSELTGKIACSIVGGREEWQQNTKNRANGQFTVQNIRIKTLQTISTVMQVIAGNPQQLRFTDGWKTENLFFTQVPKCAVVFKRL